MRRTPLEIRSQLKVFVPYGSPPAVCKKNENVKCVKTFCLLTASLSDRLAAAGTTYLLARIFNTMHRMIANRPAIPENNDGYGLSAEPVIGTGDYIQIHIFFIKTNNVHKNSAP
jgi:hypothetical protein